MKGLYFFMDNCFSFVKKRRHIIIASLVFVVTCITLLGYTAKNYSGNIDWLLLPSEYFGVPEDMKEEVDVLCRDGSFGWDGQFYYYISNDILGTEGYSQNVDSPSYRWQRVGLPLIVKCVSLLIGQKNASVGLYIFVNIAIIAIATFVFAKFLITKGRSILWVLPWAFSVGVQITLRHALPDGVADAFLLMSFIFLLQKRYKSYSACITMAALCREASILIGFILFLLAFFGKINEEKKYSIRFASIFAIPGIIFVMWYAYVTIHFGVAPFEQAYGITQIFLTGFVEHLTIAINSKNIGEIVGNIIYVITILGSIFICIFYGRKKWIYLSIIPFTILLGSFGPTVMSHYSGYLKGISSLYALIPIVIADSGTPITLNRKEIMSCFGNINKMITGLCACFLVIVFGTGIVYTEFHANNLMITRYLAPVSADTTTTPLKQISSEITLNANNGEMWVDIPYANIFMKNNHYTILNINVKNTSNETWHYQPNESGSGAVLMSYQWFRAGNMDEVYLDGYRTSLGKNVEPGETVTMDMYVQMPKDPGQYILRLSLVQEGVLWFYIVGGGYMDMNYIVT